MHSRLGIYLTLLLAALLSLLPMPDWTVWLRPAWLLMVLIYWTMSAPAQVSVGTAWFMGILMDLLTGTLLGEHAFAYTVVIYFVSKIHIRLRMYPSVQQGISILFFVLAYQFILYCIQGFIGNLPSSNLYWLSSFTSMLLWPWLFVLLKDSRRWMKGI
jgi:rod shape-determining protein MreD